MNWKQLFFHTKQSSSSEMAVRSSASIGVTDPTSHTESGLLHSHREYRDLEPKFASLETKDEDISALKLSIGSHLPKIASLVTSNFEVLVISPTGSGKSLGIPWYLSRMGYRILISVPTITAAQLLMKAQQNMNPIINVGVAEAKHSNYNDKTQIIYATSGHIRNLVMNPNDEILATIDILMLDEVHVGSLNNSLIYEVMMYENSREQVIPNLLLASATISDVKYTNAVRYKVDHVQKFRIGELWHDRNYRPGDRILLKDTADVVIRFHNTSGIMGDFLIFVAGKAEIRTMREHLERSIGGSAKILIARSGMPIKELQKVYEMTIDRTTGERLSDAPRKIIIATNLVETSITIPGIDWVFDTLVEKIAGTSSAGGFKISLQNISKSSAIQRCGRVGRIQPGYCYRMCQLDFYLKLQDERVDEIYRVPIHFSILELLNAGYSVDDIESTPVHRGVLDLVSPSKINASLRLLNKLNLIDDKSITESGSLAFRLPLSIRNGSTLLKWLENYPAYPGIVAITMIDSYGPSYFHFPRKTPSMTNSAYERILLKRKRRFNKYRGFSDVDTLLNIWVEFITAKGFDPGDGDTASWCRKEQIDVRLWINMKHRINTILKIVKDLGFPIEKGQFTVSNVSTALKQVFSETYSDLIMNRVITSQPTYQLASTSESQTAERYYLDQRYTINNLSSDYPNQIIPLIVAEFGRRRLINVTLDLSEQRSIEKEEPSDGEPLDEE
jgi:HrpA-like RNA helicase